jgi:hypothetical protein
MTKAGQILLKLPEYLLIAGVIFYWISVGVLFNPIAIALTVVLIIQIIYPIRILGQVISSLMILVSIYMLMALMSEFNEFPTFNADAKKLLFTGLLLLLPTLIFSGIMLYKYTMTEIDRNHETELSQ